MTMTTRGIASRVAGLLETRRNKESIREVIFKMVIFTILQTSVHRAIKKQKRGAYHLPLLQKMRFVLRR
jgi:hypothetical protein